MGIAMLYKDDAKVFFEWIEEGDSVHVTGFYDGPSRPNKTPMRRSDAREHWKYLLTIGFKKAFETEEKEE